MDRLRINRDYECYCGSNAALEFAAMYILEHTDVSDLGRLRIAIVSDRAVSGYYYNRFENQFIVRGIKPVLVPVECVDSDKGLNGVMSVVRFLTDFSFGDNDWLIALGGGGVLDVTSFCASVLDSRVNLMAVPTTLGSMAEGVVSDRAYLNFMSHKDYMSAPNRPDVVIIDPLFLDTVPRKITSNGYASIIRLAMLKDMSLLKDLPEKGNIRDLLNRIYEVRDSIESEDPALLGLGSEIARAIEGYFRFMNYSEGEALALSLISSLDKDRASALGNVYGRLGLPVMLREVSGKMIYKRLEEELKKNGSSKITMTVLEDGQCPRWTVKKLDQQEALDILLERIRRISAPESI